MAKGLVGMKRFRARFAATLCCGATAIQFSAVAAPAGVSDSDTDAIQDVIVTGTRQGHLEAAESPAPVQIISREALQQSATRPDLMSTLAQIVPSLTMQAFGNDMAAQTLQARMRGLSPNHVLVLINGKRRHTTANLQVDPGNPFQGSAGVDLNFIPIDAIDHVEVLTEGAAAQYGTDAIVGVINIILKKSSSGMLLNGTYGNYMDGGGNTGDVSGNAGLELMTGGYFNLTGAVQNHGHSDRSGLDAQVTNPYFLDSYPGSNMKLVPGYPDLSPIDGDAETHLKIVSLNAGVPLGDNVELYSVATYGDKRAASLEIYRVPTKVYYTDPTTGVTQYPLPFGFLPQQATHEYDGSATGGVKGKALGWTWDLSSTYGSDRVQMYTLNSANAGIYEGGLLSTTDFYDGFLRSTQWTTNLDFSRDVDVGLAGPLNIAIGAEYRRETYTVGTGTPSSYLLGGAQSFPGFTPADSGVHDRKNYAGYVDVAIEPIDNLRVDAAGRFEHYSDFGHATVGKLTGRYDFTPQFALRGTVSNGFRAPTLAEEYYSATLTGEYDDFGFLPPNSSGGKLLGLGDGLQPEKSVSESLGFVFRPMPHLNMTLDFYQILITNRIVCSGTLLGSYLGTVISPAVNAALIANGTPIDPQVAQEGLTGIYVFTNGVDTRTRGVDYSLDFPFDYERAGHVDYSIGATYNETSVTRVRQTPAALGSTALFDSTAISGLTTANPKYVVNLGASWTFGKFSANLVEKIYGPSSIYLNDYGDNSTGNLEYFKTQIGVTPITSLALSYKFIEHLTLTAGATNLFNRYPPKLNSTQLAHENDFAYKDNVGALQYPNFSPFGINGGYYFVKASLTF